jgi:voltage-gated potassium channel
MRKRLMHLLYEAVMIVLAVITVYLVIRPEALSRDWDFWINNTIWAVFAVDYGVRLLRAPSKWRFFRENIFDLVAILPSEYLRATRFLRLLRLLRLLRGVEVLWRFSAVRGILRTNRLGQFLAGSVMLVVAGGLFISRAGEPGISGFPDGVWWSLSTATGYGDFSPHTTEGRIIAVLLMFLGIVTIGMMTASIATYFLEQRGSVNRHVQHLQKELDRWDGLTKHQRHQLAHVLAALAEHEPDGAPCAEPAPEPGDLNVVP